MNKASTSLDVHDRISSSMDADADLPPVPKYEDVPPPTYHQATNYAFVNGNRNNSHHNGGGHHVIRTTVPAAATTTTQHISVLTSATTVVTANNADNHHQPVIISQFHHRRGRIVSCLFVNMGITV